MRPLPAVAIAIALAGGSLVAAPAAPTAVELLQTLRTAMGFPSI